VRYLIDTCVLSELVRPRPDRHVIAWMESCDEEAIFLSVLTLGEIQKGIEKLAPGKRRNALQAWLDRDLRSRFAGRVVAIDAEVALVWGRVQASMERAGTPLPTIDGLLCATALAHNLTIVTRNTADFLPSGANTYDPWQ
jgi:predicted nucleic acid-binding protein